MGFAEQLKRARLAAGYTQQQVAAAMGITSSTYCGYETGKRQPDVLKIKRLADILHTSGDILLETGLGGDACGERQSSAEISEAIAILGKMSPEMRKCALAQLRALGKLGKSLSGGGKANK